MIKWRLAEIRSGIKKQVGNIGGCECISKDNKWENLKYDLNFT